MKVKLFLDCRCQTYCFCHHGLKNYKIICGSSVSRKSICGALLTKAFACEAIYPGFPDMINLLLLVYALYYFENVASASVVELMYVHNKFTIN